ncbi:MAG: hypothetical protein V5A38_07595 [Halolamina sp.]|uniref:DUF7524 family protein n=1 Tax=Halolamina sp. TaxID=1940283 RepID=UPI002FC29FDA
MSALSIHLNREKPREVVAPASFEANRPFDIALQNHGDRSRVHVQLDGALSAVARLAEREHHIAEGTTEHIHVNAEAVDEAVTGELSISVGYGAATGKTEVTIEPSRQEASDITVDESLGTPQQPAESWRPDVRVLALIALAGVALLAALTVALTVESAIVLGAAVIVAVVAVVGMVAAFY